VVVLFSPSTPSQARVIGLDKVIHASLFLALALTTRLRYGRGLIWVLAYAVTSEVLQAVLPINRDGDVFDALADSVGALLGWVAAVRRPLPPDRVRKVDPVRR
jgi:VanZ family protein